MAGKWDVPSIGALFELLVSSAGLSLLLYGTLTVCGNLFLVPHSLTGALVYSTVGLYFSLSYSSQFRTFFISRLMSKNVLHFLYDKSLIEVLMDSTPSSKIYTLIAMSPLLKKDELKALIDSLPDELAYVRRPGLIHLFPAWMQSLLSESRDKFAAVANNHIGHNVDAIAAAALAEDTTIGGDERDNYFSVSRNLALSFDEIPRGIGSSDEQANNGMGSLRSTTGSSNSNGNLATRSTFDNTLFLIGSKKSKNIIDFIQKRIADNVTKSLYFFFNFGNISDAALVSTSLISTVSLLLLNKSNYRNIAMEGILSKAFSKNKKTIKMFTSLVKTILAVSAVSTSGSVLFRLLAKSAIGKINRSNASTIEHYGFSPIKLLRSRIRDKDGNGTGESNDSSYTNVISNAVADIFTATKERCMKIINYRTTVEVSFQKVTSILLLAVLLMSFRLKTDFKNMTWLYTVLYNRAFVNFINQKKNQSIKDVV